ncbi:MAG: hypothetical protein NTV61_07485 [Candidatus Bathyarchaeota archaeon]|nr:hypothetical protein [Candidatus Bathyarchaeota archaeon]
MTLIDVARRYLGWCPRFDSKLVRSTPNPFSQLSITGKAAFAALLLFTGLGSVAWTLIRVTIWARQKFYLGAFGYPVAPWLFDFFTGTLLVILTIDFLTKGIYTKRHKLELIGYIATSVSFTAYWLLLEIGVVLLNYSGATIQIYQDLRSLVYIVLGVYVAYKLWRDRKFLVKNTFLFLTIFFIGELLVMTDNAINSWEINYSSLPLDVFRMISVSYWVIYGVAALFSLKTYLKLRKVSQFELSPPLYLRGIILLYGASMLVQLLYGVALSGPITDMENYGGIVGFTIMMAISFVNSLAFIFASFHPIKFNVGEPVPHIDNPERGL